MAGTRVDGAMVEEANLALTCSCSPSPVKSLRGDPMLDEVSLCTPQKAVSGGSSRPYSIDLCLGRGERSSHAWGKGMVGATLDEEFELLRGRSLCISIGPLDGLEYLFGSEAVDFDVCRETAQAVDLCLSGPDDAGLGQTSPFLGSPIGPRSLVHESSTLSLSPSVVAANYDDRRMQNTPSLQIDEFIARYTKPLPQPILLSQTRDLVPKRSARLAAKSKHMVPKPQDQVRKVMMKRLGVQVETEHLDEATFDEFQVAFKLPLEEDTREAMQVLFHGRKQRASGSVRAT